MDKREKDPNEHGGMQDADEMLNSSGFSAWMILNMNTTNSNFPTNDRVRVVNEEQVENMMSNNEELIVIPRLNFKKIDMYRQFPKENSQDEEIKKKLKDVFKNMSDGDIENEGMKKNKV